MSRVYTANQPLYFPAVYMVERFFRCHDVVIMEEAQFSKFGHQSRIDIAAKSGKVQLVLPLENRSFRRLNEIYVHQPYRWWEKLEKTLQSVYGKYAAYKEYSPPILTALYDLIGTQNGRVTQRDVGTLILFWTVSVLRLQCKLHLSMSLVPQRPDDPNEWIIQLGRAVNCTTYIGGKVAAEEYMNLEQWKERGMSVVVQDYKMPPYQNAGGTETDGNVSFIDPLFVGGPGLVWQLIQYGD